MAENSKIEWTDHTFNPWTGCTKVSPGCDHCYAEGWGKRSGIVRWGAGEPRRRTSEANWRQPVKWNARAAVMEAGWRAGIDLYGSEEACISAGNVKPHRPRVFCASLADVFDNEVPKHWRWDLFRLIASTPNLDWLLLTKRIGNARAMLNSAAAAVAGEFVDAAEWDRAPWPNVWLGATVVNQAEADRDIPKLLAVDARVRFLSIEPMLGPIDLGRIVLHEGPIELTQYGLSAYPGVERVAVTMSALKGSVQIKMAPLSWVICGGESGPQARPMHPAWARSLRDQCVAAGVPFLFKQWGEWTDERHASPDHPVEARIGRTASRLTVDGKVHALRGPGPEQYAAIMRVGKKAAGRLLDGVEHNGFPTA